MITYAFDLYNESNYVKTFIKDFESEEAMQAWWNSQDGHPFLSYSNFRKIDTEINSGDLN